MSIFNFLRGKEGVQEPGRLERTTGMLIDRITETAINGNNGVVRFSAEKLALSDTVAEIAVTGITTTNNEMGLGRTELQSLCDHLNMHLAEDARPFSVSVKETQSAIPLTADDDFVENATFTLLVTAQP